MSKQRNWPWLSCVVFAITALCAGLQYVVPWLIPLFQRQPSLVENGEIWRLFTAWLVQTDGLTQIVLNLSMLAVAGSYVEWEFSTGVWALAYFGAGLTGELAGIFWQPVGGGNSVAVAGLAGVALMHLARRREVTMWVRLVWPLLGLIAALVWCVGADIHGPALLFGYGLGVICLARRPAQKQTGT